jgi:cytochrome P450
MISVCVPAANSDPAKFEDPLRFNVLRANASEHFGFGRGRHFCLGAAFAPQEAQIALELLYNRLPDLQADLDQQVEFLPSLGMRVFLSQQVSWRP